MKNLVLRIQIVRRINVILITSAFFLLFQSNSLAQVLSENWESPTWYTKWMITAGTWEVGVPTSGPNAAHGGANCAATVLAGNYAEGVDSRLISPSFTVPSANQNPRLRFWHWFSFNSDDYGKVQIKTSSGTQWIDIGGSYVNTGSGVWTYPSIDLSAYSGQNVQIAFYFHSQTNYYGSTYVSTGWYLDDVIVETGTVAFDNPKTWESGLGDWGVDKGTWEVGTPTSGPSATHGGTKCAATVLGGNYAEGVDSRLISPSFVVPATSQNPRLRFWHWFSFNSDDYGKVQIKTTSGTHWIDISGSYINTGSGVWTYPSIDLSAYSGQNVQIAFYFHSQNNYYGSTYVSTGWYLDDVTVETGPVPLNNPETWESGIGGWGVDKGTWEVGTPTSGPTAAHSGTKCASTVLAGNYAEGVDSRLISPAFTVPSANQNPRLRFWHWFSFNSDDYGKVQIKTTSGTEWIDIGGSYVNTGSGVWTYPSIDLTVYSGQNVQIAFYFHSQTNYYGSTYVSAGWYIDDFAIITGPNILNNPAILKLGKQVWETGE
jgi:hypothetical protein